MSEDEKFNYFHLAILWAYLFPLGNFFLIHSRRDVIIFLLLYLMGFLLIVFLHLMDNRQ